LTTSSWPAGWGRHLEDELMGVAPILLYVASHAPGESPTGEIRSRSATLHIFTSQSDFEEWAADIWRPDRAVYGRQVPAIRFDTVHGSVAVGEMWDDTGFEFLHRKPGNRALKVNTPLSHVAGWISQAARTVVHDELPVFVISPIGWTETEPMPPRKPLRGFASYAAVESATAYSDYRRDEGYYLINDGNDADRSGVRGLIEAFSSVNTEAVRLEARATLDRARSAAADLGRVDVNGGIAEIERFLYNT
jgi:hypothetical protein